MYGVNDPGHCDLDLGSTDSKSTGIIYGPWPTKTLIMVSKSLTGFKLKSRQESYAPGHFDLDF